MKKQWRAGAFGPFLAVKQFLAIQSCYSSAICGLIHGLLYLHSLQIWTFTNSNNFGRYRCCNQILVTFANFAKLWTVGLWAFFNFVLFRYERLQNLLFLVLIRCLLSLFLWLQWKFLLLLRFLRHLRTFQGPSSPFFLSLEFGYVCYSCYSCHMCYSVLLDSGFLEALLGLFPF